MLLCCSCMCVFLDTHVCTFLLNIYLAECATSTFIDNGKVFVPVHDQAAVPHTPAADPVSTVTITHSGRYAVVYHGDLKYILPLFYQ